MLVRVATIQDMTDWITTEEACQLTGYSSAHLLYLLRGQKIKGDKKGGQYWIDKRDLMEYARRAKKSVDKRWGARSKKTS